MTPSQLSSLQCQPCKNRDPGLFLCPNCGREYSHTTLPSLLLNASLAIAIFALAHVRAWWSHLLDSGSAFVVLRAKKTVSALLHHLSALLSGSRIV